MSSGAFPINWAAIEGGPNGTQWGFVYVPVPGEVGIPQTGAARATKNQWCNIEMYLVMNTADTSDGIMKIWVDGEVAEDRSDIRYLNGASPSWKGMRFDGTRGGGTSTTPTPAGGQVRRYNRLAFYASDT